MGISGGSAVLPAQFARLSCGDLPISLGFSANASTNQGFTLLKVSVLGAGGGFTASVKDGLESDK